MFGKQPRNKGLAWKCMDANLLVLTGILIVVIWTILFEFSTLEGVLGVALFYLIFAGVAINLIGIAYLAIDLFTIIFGKPESKPSLVYFLISLPIIPLILVFCLKALDPFPNDVTRSKIARTKGDQRTLTIALETYYLDQRNYPAWSLDRSQKFAGEMKDRKGILERQPTFRLRNGSALNTLTTPVSYMSKYYLDPWSPIKGASFSYWTNATATTTATGYILWSPGPDGVYDLSIDNIAKAYDPKTSVPSNLLIQLTYDPSNGAGGRGDIWRVKQ